MAAEDGNNRLMEKKFIYMYQILLRIILNTFNRTHIGDVQCHYNDTNDEVSRTRAL